MSLMNVSIDILDTHSLEEILTAGLSSAPHILETSVLHVLVHYQLEQFRW
jgi:hypothetical protein